MKLSLFMYSDSLTCVWILVYAIGIIEVSNPRVWSFLFYFSSLHDFWPPRTWNSLVHTSWSEMERCEFVLFSFSKCEKKISWNIKSKCITVIYLQLGLRELRIITVITRWAHNNQTFTLISKIIMRIWKICLHLTDYVNTK